MARAKQYKITIRVRPTNTSQSVQVVGSGKAKKLLMGLIRTEGFLLPLTVAADEKTQALAVLSQATGLVELL